MVLRTKFGTVPVATRVIDRVDPQADGECLLLSLRNGDEVVGMPLSASLSFAIGERVIEVPLLLGGGCLQGTSFRNHFTTDASIDELRIYDRALGPGEVRLLYGCESRASDDAE